MSFSPKEFGARLHARLHLLFLSGFFLLAVFVPLRMLPVAQATRETPVAEAATPRDVTLPIVSRPNRHYTAAKARTIDTVVIHHISAINVDAARWADPDLSMKILDRYRVSAHYLIDRAGQIYRLVDERNVAYHAGGSIMPAPDNRRSANRFSIGIELIATTKSGYTEAQYEAVSTLVQGIRSRHPIRHVVGHDEIAGSRAVQLGLRRDVKPDPGPLFDWSRVR